MPEITNNTEIHIDSIIEDDDRETMIKVENVGMTFNMASEQLNSLKEYAIALFKRNLFFKELRALNDISFEVKKGDVYGIVGTNGSGKSTLLKIVAGVLEPTDGKVTINGSIAPLIELGAGFDMELTARENIYLNGALLGYSNDFIDEHFDAIVEFAEIDKFLDMPMKNYSSGMVARIAFAIATVIVPEILIVDEVLSVGDFMFQKKCEDRIQELIKDHGTTVLIVSHSIEQVQRLCNKAIWIEKGKTRINGTAEDVCSIYSLIGGRTGSLEAEKTIIDACLKTKEIDQAELSKYCFDATEQTNGESCLELTKKATSDASLISDVVLVSPVEHIYTSIGHSIAGALKCPQISYAQDKPESSLINWLDSVQPENIYILDRYGCEATRRLLNTEFSWRPSIHYISGDGAETPLKWQLKVLDYFSQSHIDMGNHLILTKYSDNVLSTAGLCSFSYSNAFPILSIHSTEDSIDDLIKWLRTNRYNAISFCNDIAKDTEDKLVSVFKNYKLMDDYDPKRCYEFKKPENEAHESLLFVPFGATMFTSYSSAGFYCANEQAKLEIIDNTSLQSLSKACKSVQNKGCKKIAFIQGESNLTSPVVNVLSKLVALNNQNC